MYFSNLEKPAITDVMGMAIYNEIVGNTLVELRKRYAGKNNKIPQGDARIFFDMADLDESFHDLIKYDIATSKIHFHPVYGSIDDLYFAVYLRASEYGLNLTTQARKDVVSYILSKKENKFNSIKMWVNKMQTYTPVFNPLNKMLAFMHYKDEKERQKYHTFWDLFFRSSATHICSSFIGQPFPSEIVPILVSTQGKGKTRFCSYLATDPELYVDLGNKASALGSPDSLRLMTGKIISELGEMSIWKKADVETVKSFITQKVDSWVPKYKEGVVEFKRTTCFIGNSNEDKFLRDFSGNRRWFPVLMSHIDQSLFDDAQLIKEVWGWYLTYALDLISRGDYQELYVSQEMTDFFEEKRSNAIETGTEGEYLLPTINAMEEELLKNAHPMDRYIYIDSKLVASAFYGDGNASKASYNFRKIVTKICHDLGYEVNIPVRLGGIVMKKHRILYDVLKARRDGVELPEEAKDPTTEAPSKPIVNVKQDTPTQKAVLNQPTSELTEEQKRKLAEVEHSGYGW